MYAPLPSGTIHLGYENKHNRPVALFTPYCTSAHTRTILRSNSITIFTYACIIAYFFPLVKWVPKIFHGKFSDFFRGNPTALP